MSNTPKNSGKGGTSGEGRPNDVRVGERLLALLNEFGSRVEASEVAGVVPDQLSKYVRGAAKPTLEVVARLAQAKGYSLDWLWSGEGPQNIGGPSAHEALDGYATIPVWSIEASSGHGTFVGHEEIGTDVLIPLRIIRKFGGSPGNMHAVFNRGSSNAPDINDGDIMFVDRSVEQVRDDAYYLFQEDDALLVKMIERDVGGGVILKSRNPSYVARELSREDAARLNVFGRVRWRVGSI